MAEDATSPGLPNGVTKHQRLMQHSEGRWTPFSNHECAKDSYGFDLGRSFASLGCLFPAASQQAASIWRHAVLWAAPHHMSRYPWAIAWTALRLCTASIAIHALHSTLWRAEPDYPHCFLAWHQSRRTIQGRSASHRGLHRGGGFRKKSYLIPFRMSVRAFARVRVFPRTQLNGTGQ